MSGTLSSEAARQLIRARWGDTRVRGLVHELVERRDELGADLRAELRQLLDNDDTEGDSR